MLCRAYRYPNGIINWVICNSLQIQFSIIGIIFYLYLLQNLFSACCPIQSTAICLHYQFHGLQSK